jgi:hypothetical protein
MRKSRVIKILFFTLFLALLMDGVTTTGTSGVALADGGDEVRTTARLVSTGVRPNAAGTARTRSRSDRQRIDFEINGLNANAPYRFVADGITLGTRTASATGRMDVSFRDGGIPDDLKPVSEISRLEVFTGADQLALFADL